MPTKDKQQWYIFTFGSGQQHAGHYVKFFGTFETARSQMIEQYGIEWGFQYSEDEWNEWLRTKPEWIPAETELK